MMNTLEQVKKELRAQYHEAAFWRRHYEVAYQQEKSVQAQRSCKYYEGLMRGYEVAFGMICDIA